MACTRRQAVLTALLGQGSLGLLSWATGLPTWLLAAPSQAAAKAAQAEAARKQGRATFLIAAWSQHGEPLGANVPGTYDDAGIVHPPQPAMAAAPLWLGEQPTRGAAPWAALAPSVLGRTAFLHHATGNVVHADAARVLGLNQACAGGGPLLGWLARQLAGPLGTQMREPIVLGGGWQPGAAAAAPGARPQQQALLPTTLAALLTAPGSPLAELEAVRERVLAQVAAACRAAHAAPGLVDHYSIDQRQLRARSDVLRHSLAQIKRDDAAGQLRAAIALVALKVAPVIAVYLPFGGDNHSDPQLAGEARQSVASVANIGELQAELATARLQDEVTFATFDVFGRSLAADHLGTLGRDHNANHQATVLIGPRVRAGVVGGVARMGADYGATGIDADTGRSSLRADVAPAETLAATGKTVAAACGVPDSALAAGIAAGKVLRAALTPGLAQA